MVRLRVEGYQYVGLGGKIWKTDMNVRLPQNVLKVAVMSSVEVVEAQFIEVRFGTVIFTNIMMHQPPPAPQAARHIATNIKLRA
jgi:hypothetical protein